VGFPADEVEVTSGPHGSMVRYRDDNGRSQIIAFAPTGTLGKRG
jgi:hypothetical protein